MIGKSALKEETFEKGTTIFKIGPEPLWTSGADVLACVHSPDRTFRSGSNDALLHQPPFLRGLRSAKEDAKANKPKKKKKKQNASKKRKKPQK